MRKEVWLIEPRDSLIARDGKPFGMAAGNRATSLAFPFPSTTTGAARTRAGLSTINGDASKFSTELGDEVQQKIAVRGALLAELNGRDDFEILVPAPSDGVIFENESKDERRGTLIPLAPLENGDEFASNLQSNLHLLGLRKFELSKPHKRAPKFWRWSAFEKWLECAEIQPDADLTQLGIEHLPKDRRTHVKIDYGAKAREEGNLFQTRGLEFRRACDDDNSFKNYALVLQIEYDGFNGAIQAGLAPLGGERRLVAWRKVERSDSLPTRCPQPIADEIIKRKHCRLILLTPAVFADGYLPQWANGSLNVLKVKVEAAAVNRYQTISGWDFKQREPKPTRRLCPAGTVFFLALEGDETQIKNWIEATWFSCVSDEAQDRRDGFGLCVLGTWSGDFLPIEEALQ
jgi:CRISPR-associated protein Cmr3